MLDPEFHDELRLKTLPSDIPDTKAPNSFFKVFKYFYDTADTNGLVIVEGSPKEIDVSSDGPYAYYNWELLFHIPLAIEIVVGFIEHLAVAAGLSAVPVVENVKGRRRSRASDCPQHSN